MIDRVIWNERYYNIVDFKFDNENEYIVKYDTVRLSCLKSVSETTVISCGVNGGQQLFEYMRSREALHGMKALCMTPFYFDDDLVRFIRD